MLIKIQFIVYDLENLNRRGRHSIRKTTLVWWAWASLTFRKLTQLRGAPWNFLGMWSYWKVLGELRFVLICGCLSLCSSGWCWNDSQMKWSRTGFADKIKQLSHFTDLNSSRQQCATLSLWTVLVTSSVVFRFFTRFSSPFSASTSSRVCVVSNTSYASEVYTLPDWKGSSKSCFQSRISSKRQEDPIIGDAVGPSPVLRGGGHYQEIHDDLI